MIQKSVTNKRGTKFEEKDQGERTELVWREYIKNKHGPGF